MNKLIYILTLLFVLFSCDKDYNTEDIPRKVNERLHITRLELLDISKNKTNIDYFKNFQEKNSYKPLIKINSIKAKSSNIISLDSKSAFLGLFNSDNVFQFDNYIVFLENT
ncbi:hypothetical protein ACL9RF_00970 [Sphingobacterium sp. Mn56C]|uniref:hypothetical protein n=1 Tax=Sphingobacterium sp. Mn56C TaxID=3395261 RepID=UPI003BD2EE0D